MTGELPLDRLGEYRILRRIGQGGMGEVYEAVQESLGRTVAIKILPAALARDEEMVRRFRREAEAAAAVRHPNLVAIHGAGSEGPIHWLAMEFVEGETLAEAIAGTPAGIPEPTVVELGRQVARGLAAAHAAGIVHRDIKPSNLILRVPRSAGAREVEVEAEDATVRMAPPGPRALEVVVTDFGLARPFGGSDLTASGAMVGTPAYMAPEQLCESSIDGRADLYALGLVLYEASTGAHPFRSADLGAVVARVLAEAPAPPRTIRPELGRALETVILKALEKDPANRYQDAVEFEEELARVARGEPVSAVPLRGRRRSWRLAAAGGLVGLVALAVVMGARLLRSQDVSRQPGGEREVEDPRHGPIDWSRVDRRLGLGMWEEIERELEPILSAHPTNARARHLRGLAVLASKVLRVNSPDGRSRQFLIAADSPDFDRVSAGFFNRWAQPLDPADARRAAADFAIAIAAGHEVARSRFCRAACLAADGQFDPALVELEALPGGSTGAAHALVGRGLVLLAADRLPEAGPPIEQAIQLDPGAPASWYARWALRVRQGDSAGAELAFKEGNRVWLDILRRVEDPDGLGARLDAIELDFQANRHGDVEKAIEALRLERERLRPALVRLLRLRRGAERNVPLKALVEVYREDGPEILHELLFDPDEELGAVALRLLAQYGEDVSERARTLLGRTPAQRWHLACALLLAGSIESADELGSLALSTLGATALLYEPYGWLAGERALDVHRRVAVTASHASRIMAIELLGWFGNREDVSLLVRLLDDPTAFVAEAAARALGRLGEPGAAQQALERFHDRTHSLSAAWALRLLGQGRFGDALGEPLSEGRSATFQQVSGWYFQLPAHELFVPALEALSGAEGSRRILIMAELVSVADVPDVPRLLELVDLAGPTDRRMLVRALGLAGDPSAADALARVFAGMAPGYDRLQVAWALARSGARPPSEIELPEARKFLRMHSGRLAGAEILARQQDPVALEFLAGLVARWPHLPPTIPSWGWLVEIQPESLVFQAAEALALVGDKRGLAALPGFLTAADPRERQQADRTLRRMTGRSVDFDPLSPRPRLEAARDEWRRIIGGS